MTLKEKTAIMRHLNDASREGHKAARLMMKNGLLTGNLELALRTIEAAFDSVAHEETTE